MATTSDTFSTLRLCQEIVKSQINLHSGATRRTCACGMWQDPDEKRSANAPQQQQYQTNRQQGAAVADSKQIYAVYLHYIYLLQGILSAYTHG